MTPNERLGDRRGELRFEILGDLWATIVTTQSLPLVNLGSGGILVESAGPLVVGSVQPVRLTLGDQVCDVSATIRHVTPAQASPNKYLVGMQFADLPAEVQATIDAFIASRGGVAAGNPES